MQFKESLLFYKLLYITIKLNHLLNVIAIIDIGNFQIYLLKFLFEFFL